MWESDKENSYRGKVLAWPSKICCNWRLDEASEEKNVVLLEILDIVRNKEDGSIGNTAKGYESIVQIHFLSYIEECDCCKIVFV